MPKNKRKGTAAEVELYKLFNEKGFRAVRVAGSGIMENADCDLIALKKGIGYCVEVKASKKPVKYIEKDQVQRFNSFADEGGLTPVIALKFNYEGWYFISPLQLKETEKAFGIKLKELKNEGKRFDEFFTQIQDSHKQPSFVSSFSS